MTYAENTSVSVERSQAQIQTMLRNYGAEQFMSGWSGSTATVGFVIDRRAVKFELPLPDSADPKFTRSPGGRRERTAEAAGKAWEQACRSRWRALFLVIKAKLEAVEVGISTIEQEFLAWTVVPGRNGQVVGQLLLPELNEAIETGRSPQLLLSKPK